MIAELDRPFLIGVSRKSMLGQITGRPVTERVVASATAAMLAAQAGASVVRVHDVRETVDALKNTCRLTMISGFVSTASAARAHAGYA